MPSGCACSTSFAASCEETAVPFVHGFGGVPVRT